MLYLLATRQAQDRQDVVRLLGVHRNTIGRWLARYAAGGLEALLATSISPGKPVSLAPAVLRVPCGERLQRVIPPENTGPVRVFSQPDSRFGPLTIRRRRLTARGMQ